MTIYLSKLPPDVDMLPYLRVTYSCKVTGRKPGETTVGSTVLYKASWLVSSQYRQDDAVTAEGIAETYEGLAEEYVTKYNRYEQVSVELKITKADIIWKSVTPPSQSTEQTQEADSTN